MDRDHDPDTRRVSDDTAERLLTLAAQLDAGTPAGLSLTELRRVAVEAGIAPEAFEAALGSALAAAPGPGGHAAASRVPRWVRLCLFGVPDRQSAMAFYWLFALALCGLPALTAAGVLGLAGAGALAGFLLFAGWSTSRAVRWLDRHGWDALP